MLEQTYWHHRPEQEHFHTVQKWRPWHFGSQSLFQTLSYSSHMKTRCSTYMSQPSFAAKEGSCPQQRTYIFIQPAWRHSFSLPYKLRSNTAIPSSCKSTRTMFLEPSCSNLSFLGRVDILGPRIPRHMCPLHVIIQKCTRYLQKTHLYYKVWHTNTSFFVFTVNVTRSTMAREESA